jgi:hypothetical protein
MMTQLQPGDLVEIQTPAGFAYAQVTHTHRAYPEVVRFLAGVHRDALEDTSVLKARPTAFVAMFPLGGAIETETLIGRKVGSMSIPGKHKPFPTFKMPIRDRLGDVVYWWLWKGEGLNYDATQNVSHDALPMREVMAATDLKDKLRNLELV